MWRCRFSFTQITSILVIGGVFASGDAAVASQSASQLRGLAQRAGNRGGRRSNADVYYVTKVADRFRTFAHKRRLAVDAFHDEERQRLEEAINKAADVKDKDILTMAAVSDEETRMEAQNALNAMTNFITTLKQAMGARGGVSSCDELSCGTHAYCAMSELEGARCVCEQGYEGTGYVCNPPKTLTTLALIHVTPNMPPPEVADVHVAMLGGNRIGVTYRDVAKGHLGYLLVGKAGATEVDWDAPVPFSNQTGAFGPVLASLRGGAGFAVAYRDTNLGGSGFLLSGTYNATSKALVFGSGRAFARHQAQGMAILPVSESRVIVVFAEHVIGGTSGKLSGGAMYGAALLAAVFPGSDAPPEFLAKHRFASGPVARISATLLSPVNFVIGFRLGESGQSTQQMEASCVFGQLHENKLIFDPHVVSLEPAQSQIWARSVAPIDSSTFSYTYYSGNEQVTKQAIIRVDDATHRMLLAQAPKVIGRGFTPYVGTVSAAVLDTQSGELSTRQATGPRLLTFHNREGTVYPQGHMCKVSVDGTPTVCRDVEWGTQEIISVGSAAVGDGRLLVVSVDSGGVPYYNLVGFVETH